jgi:hypothetical protein
MIVKIKTKGELVEEFEIPDASVALAEKLGIPREAFIKEYVKEKLKESNKYDE